MNKYSLFFAAVIAIISACSPNNDPLIVEPAVKVSYSTAPAGLFDTHVSSYWATYPIIKICPNAGISEERVRQAVSFWKDAGYIFGGIELIQPSAGPCDALPGEIVFRAPTQSEISNATIQNKLAVTETSYDRTSRRIMMASIYFQTTLVSHKAKVVEHELGHALGWSHHFRSGHIMHPNLERGGLSKLGMEKRDYESRIRELLVALDRDHDVR